MIHAVTSRSGEIVSLDEAKQQLRVWDPAEDNRVRSLLSAARSYCERWGEITLTQTATRTVKCEAWPSGGWVLKNPPVTAVTSITYIDADGDSQTLAASNYRTHLTEAGFGLIEWDDDAVLPTLASRDDAITVTYTTGWGENAPEDAKAAILLTLQSIDAQGDTRDLAYAENAAKGLLSGLAAWTYA
jgi:uncharacterized phiE125 gp8 family phage protein